MGSFSRELGVCPSNTQTSQLSSGRDKKITLWSLPVCGSAPGWLHMRDRCRALRLPSTNTVRFNAADKYCVTTVPTAATKSGRGSCVVKKAKHKAAGVTRGKMHIGQPICWTTCIYTLDLDCEQVSIGQSNAKRRNTVYGMDMQIVTHALLAFTRRKYTVAHIHAIVQGEPSVVDADKDGWRRD